MAELFIVGVGRSGTSLLQSMLAAHPAVAMLPETSFMRRYVARQPKLAVETAALPGQDERLQRLAPGCWQLALAQLPAGLADSSNSGHALVALCRALLSPEVAGCQAERAPEEISYVGDKDPRLIEYLPLIAALFPEAEIIHIIRDPRDVLLSKGKAGWSEGRDWRLNLAAGRFQLDLAHRFLRSPHSVGYHELRYEDLLSDPAGTMERLLERLGLPYSEVVLEFAQAADKLSGGQMEEWKKETLGPLLAKNHGKWKKGLTTRQIRAVEGAFARTLKEQGYERSGRLTLRGWFYRFGLSFASAIYGNLRLLQIEYRLRKLRSVIGGRNGSQ